MPNIVTNITARTTSIVWSDRDVAVLQWGVLNGYIESRRLGINITTVPQAAEALLTAAFKGLFLAYLDDVARRRQAAHDAASASSQAAADAALGFTP